MGASKYPKSTVNNLWYDQSSYIKWAYENQNEFPTGYIQIGAKIGIINMLCSLIEGVCGHVLSDNLMINPSINYITDIDEMQKKINKATWNTYDSLFIQILKNNISYYVKGGHKDNIDILFKMRNSIVHGNAVIFREKLVDDIHSKTIDGGKYDEIYQFLIKNGLTSDVQDVNWGAYKLFSDEIMKYFLNETINFIEQVSKPVICDEFSNGLINDCILTNLKAI